MTALTMALLKSGIHGDRAHCEARSDAVMQHTEPNLKIRVKQYNS